ncbi:hypothetical protein, partial [Halobacillus sp. BBL2006]|uniref:hypothetical protein n=1 Tax=Halobacillus sp. BBL2006 TaxID=1543706 RepID=UPI0005419961
MNHFKDKRFWMLIPPFFITFLLLFILLPYEYKFYSFVVLLVFWMVYYTWNHLTEKRKKKEIS